MGATFSTTRRNELLKVRFVLNMKRINGLVRLLYSSEALKPTASFHSEGARADILRSIVVFLHAMFEVVLRSRVPQPDKRLSVYSGADIDKALKLSGIDAKPFKHLYPPLTQLAKRRKRIVHEGDLSQRDDTTPGLWELADDWQLIMWLMAVPAFYYQLCISIDAASDMERELYKRHRRAMRSHLDFGKKLVACPQVPRELRIEALENMSATLTNMAGTLRFNVSE
jgi:hypothetical protein